MGCGTSKVLPADPASPKPADLVGPAPPRPAETNIGANVDTLAKSSVNIQRGTTAPRQPAEAAAVVVPKSRTGDDSAVKAAVRSGDDTAGPAPLPGSAPEAAAEGPATVVRHVKSGDVDADADRAAAAAVAVADKPVAGDPAEPPVIIDDDPLAVVSKGISLRGLRKLRQRLIDFFGGEAEYGALNTEDVNTRWVQVVTRGSLCRVAEDPSLVAPEDVGPPEYFISHAWKNRFDLLLASVEAFLTIADEETRVWIDILAVNQHPTMPHQARDVAAFKEVVRASSAGTLVVLDLANINPATRAWCIYEWAATLALHGPEGLHLRVGPEGRAKLVSSLDVMQAECYNPSDKEMILADVVAQHGSTAAFNTKLRLQLALEPLSYAVDIRRLAERAEGTAWRFGPVEEWLAEGASHKWESGGRHPASLYGDENAEAELQPPMPPRALVVAGGAGEGKSTVSAMLVGGLGASAGSQMSWGVKRPAGAGAGNDADGASGGGGGGAIGCVSAHHFLKYNDQRRLDPVRIVKSLAFQLAARIPQVAEALLSERPDRLISPPNIGSACGILLDSPLRDLHQPQQIVILIDALPPGGSAAFASGGDGVSSIPCGNKTFQLIAKHLDFLPAFVRFVVTTRPDAVGGSVVPALQRLFAKEGGVTLLRPGELRQPAAAADDDGSGGGVMVYHTVASKCLPPPPVEREAAAAAAPPPPPGKKARPSLANLYDLYGTVFSRAWASYDAREAGAVRRLLEALLAAQEPLPQSRLQALGLARLPAKLPGWPVLFTVEEHHLYTLHKSLADWLTTKDVGGGGGGGKGDAGGGGGVVQSFLEITTANGHLQLARQLASERSAAAAASRAGGDGGGGGSGNGGASAISPYCNKYLVRHLVMAAAAAPPDSAVRREAHDLLTDVLFDFEFMAGAFREGHGYGLIEDLAAAREPPPAVYDALRWLLAQQHGLREVREAAQLLPSAMLCPTGTAAFRRATEFNAELARRAGRLGYRFLQQLGGPEVSWPTLKSKLQGYKYFFTGVAFSPDGRVVANTSDSKEGFIRVWDARSGAQLTTIEPRRMRGVDFSYDLKCVAFSPDGRTMLAGSSVARIFMYDVMTGDNVGVIAGHTSTVHSLVFFEIDGETVLVSAEEDKTVRIWRHRPEGAAAAAAEAAAVVAAEAAGEAQDMPAWRKALVAEGQGFEWQCFAVLTQTDDASICSMAAGKGPRGRPLIVTGGFGAVVRVWERRQGDGDGDGGGGGGGGGHSDGGISEGNQPALGSGGWVCTAELAQGNSIESLDLSPDGTTIASTDRKIIRLWRRRRPAAAAAAACGGSGDDNNNDEDAPWQCVAMLKGHVASVRRLLFFKLHGLTVLASGGGMGDETVQLWVQSRAAGAEPEQGQGAAAASASAAAAAAAALEPGASGASAGGDGDGGGGDDVGDDGWRRAVVLKGHDRDVLCLASNPANPLCLASGGEDGTVRLWDLRPREVQDLQDAAAGRPVAVQGPTKEQYICIRCVALSPGHGWLAATVSDDTLRVWRRAEDSDCWGDEAVLRGFDVSRVTFSRPDAEGRIWMATGDGFGNVRLWLHNATATSGAATTAAGSGPETTPPGGAAVGGWSCLSVLEPPPPIGKTSLNAVSSVCFGGGFGAGSGSGGAGSLPLILAATGLAMARVWTQSADDSRRWESLTVETPEIGQYVYSADPVVVRSDGRAVAGVTADDIVRVWTSISALPRSARSTDAPASAAHWQLTATLKVKQHTRYLAMSPDGRWLAMSCGTKECSVWYHSTHDDGEDEGGGGGSWDGATAAVKAELRAEDCPRSEDSSSDDEGGRPAGQGRPVGRGPSRRDPQGGWVHACDLGHPSRVGGLCFSADSRTLATYHGDQRREEKLVRLYRLTPGAPAAPADPGSWQNVLELRGHPEMVLKLAFSPTDPTLFVTGSIDAGVRVWQLLEPDGSGGVHGGGGGGGGGGRT